MPSVIRVLDDHTINKIAAGEVIENPSSVVKELVENAVDAGATEICVEIKAGGRQLIRITDNGCGMNKDDALLAFERHATSKIHAIDDLHALTTMGFRGEAVPSIAAISKLTLLTNDEDGQEGTLVISEGGKILKCCPGARSRGTTFEIQSLFYNVPVRKKFQRSPNYDTSEILKILSMQALAHSDIRFQLISNQKNLLSTKPPESDEPIPRIGERISDVLGSDYFTGLIPVDYQFNAYRLVGYCGQPSFTRHNRSGQYLFINQRCVYSHLISNAVKEAYGTAMATNRHPVFVLYLAMEGSKVDVNVHPQKREVRLRHELQLREMITAAIEQALRVSGPATPSSEYNLPEAPAVSFTPAFANKAPLPIREASGPQYSWKEQAASVALEEEEEEEEEEQAPPSASPSLLSEKHASTTHFPRSRVIAAVKGYLILTSEEGNIQLLDQRASHARILYEQLLAHENNRGALAVQNLLIPLTLEFDAANSEIVRNSMEHLNALGFKIEEFGSDHFIVHSIPQLFANADIEALLLEIVMELRRFQCEKTIDSQIKKKIALAAGRAALSQKTRLSIPEGQSLYEQLVQCQTPFQCPGGKPTLKELSEEEIAKQFQK